MVERLPRVLVVDDDERIAASVRRALVYEGYDVDVAADGRAALTRVSESPPDLVILDVMLPGVDGLEVCRRLRADTTAELLSSASAQGSLLSTLAIEPELTVRVYVQPWARPDLGARGYVLVGPPADLERIFDRFFQADAARAASGAGLGLSIGRWIVAEHGGRIRAENRADGHGAVFVAELPVMSS